MGANSLSRRIIKRVLAPVMTDSTYRIVQGVAKAWDIRSGSWMEPEVALAMAQVREGDTVLDIGANFGMYSYHLSHAVGKTGRVYAFEPIPFTSATFRFVARLLQFRNVELIEKGCGEHNGKMTFTVPIQESGAIVAGLVHAKGRNDEREGWQKWARYRQTKEIECEVIAVDEWLPEVSALSLIKCDIEGADLYAMRGAKQTIEKFLPVIICEVSPWFLEGFGIGKEQVISFFTDRGYRPYRMLGGKLRLTPTVEQEGNWVFVHPENQARVAHLIAETAQA